MNYNNGFARDEFLQYMFEEFPSAFENPFSRELLENVVDYGIKNKTESKNSLYYYLSGMIPEVVPKDLIPYIDKSLLTDEVLCLVDEHDLSGSDIGLTKDNHLGEFNIPALMSALENNAWYGAEPIKVKFMAGEDVITLEGYTYEPIYEEFSSTSSISFNGKVLYGIDSRNVDAYKNEVYNIGKFNTLDEAISYIKEQIKGREVVILSESSSIDEKIASATDRSKQGMSIDEISKDDVVLE